MTFHTNMELFAMLLSFGDGAVDDSLMDTLVTEEHEDCILVF